MITMKVLRFLLAPTLLALLAAGDLKIYPEGDERTLPIGGSLALTCVNSLQTPTDMVWKGPDGQELASKRAKQIELTFRSLTLEQSGRYTCEATINGIPESATFLINVEQPLEFLSETDQDIKNGTEGFIYCKTTPYPGKVKTIDWVKDGVDVNTTDENGPYSEGVDTSPADRGHYLRVKKAKLSDTGRWACHLTIMKAGIYKEYTIDVIVTVAPKITSPILLNPTTPMEGDRLIMSCQASGIPKPTYMYYKDNTPLLEDRSSDGEYLIEDVKRTNEEEYRCNAYNLGGSVDATLDLDVKIRPSFENTDNVTARAGKAVRLPCIATGDPVPSMTWTQKDSDVYYLDQQNSMSDIYVETVDDDPIRDGDSVLYRRTLYLVIDDLKSEHAGLYVCKADNSFGQKTRTFKIDVEYKPNFKNQETAMFYGWAGGKTNLTCIANGNPEAVITWFRGGDNLDGHDDYTVTPAKPMANLPHRVVGYLEPKVKAGDDALFGEYKCQATNRFGTSDQMLQFKKAVPPEAAVLNLLETKATELTLSIGPPSNNGGRPVIKYSIIYGPSDSSEQPLERTINRLPSEPSTMVTLDELTPNTIYSIKVYAISVVGKGDERRITESTQDISKPDPVVIISEENGLIGTSYTLVWEPPMTGGARITNYVFTWGKIKKIDAKTLPWKVIELENEKWQEKNVKVKDGQEMNSYTLKGLEPEKYYQVKISAVNKIDGSEFTVFTFRTGRGGQKIGKAGSAAIGTGGLALLVIVVLVLLAVAVDMAFCRTKQCGVIWMVSSALGRKEEGTESATKSPEDGDEAAAKLLGKDKDDSLRTENETKPPGGDSTGEGTAQQKDVEDGGQPMDNVNTVELEPEDKDKDNAAVEVEQAAPPVKEPAQPTQPAGEATTEVETKPPADKPPAEKPPTA